MEINHDPEVNVRLDTESVSHHHPYATGNEAREIGEMVSKVEEIENFLGMNQGPLSLYPFATLAHPPFPA